MANTRHPDDKKIPEKDNEKKVEAFSYTKKALSSISLRYNGLRCALGDWDKHSHIMTGIFLGQIPHVGLGGNTNTEIQNIFNFVDSVNPNRPLGLILSVTEKAEVDGSLFLFNNTVKPHEWENAGVKQQLLNMPDFSADVKLEDCIKALDCVEKCIKNGQSALIHCKAGRARSAMFLAIYMALNVDKPETNTKYSVTEAIAVLKNSRKQVDVSQSKIEAAKYIVSEIKKIRSENKSEAEPSNHSLAIRDIERILVSKELKDSILKTEAIKELLHYQEINKGSKRDEHITEIINLIKKPHSEQWLTMLTKKTGHVDKLLKATPQIDDKAERSRLIENLNKFVFNVLEKKLAEKEIPKDMLEKYCEGKLAAGSELKYD